MKVIIIEDEHLSAEHLVTLLKKIDSTITVLAIFDSVKKSIEELKKGFKADILFVDIHLADGISFDIFSKVAIDIPVIFTTAYNEYAIQAFKVNSIDYLLKPIAVNDLELAINKYKKLNKFQQLNIEENIVNAYKQISKQYKNRFMVKMGDSISSIKTEDILHFISEDGLVLIATEGGKRFVVDYTLDALEALLLPEMFFRINRKVIVNINCIHKVVTYFNSRLKINTPALTNDDAIVSRERVGDFKQWLDK